MGKRKYVFIKTCIKCKKDTRLQLESKADYDWHHKNTNANGLYLKYVCFYCQKEIDKMVENGSGI